MYTIDERFRENYGIDKKTGDWNEGYSSRRNGYQRLSDECN